MPWSAPRQATQPAPHGRLTQRGGARASTPNLAPCPLPHCKHHASFLTCLEKSLGEACCWLRWPPLAACNRRIRMPALPEAVRALIIASLLFTLSQTAL